MTAPRRCWAALAAESGTASRQAMAAGRRLEAYALAVHAAACRALARMEDRDDA